MWIFQNKMKEFETEILNPRLEHYISGLSSHDDPVLKDMETLAEKTEFPIIGPLVGRILYQITLISGARKILELGSGFGYSAIWFAKAVRADGEIICTDKSHDNCNKAREYFSRASVQQKIRYEVGDSLEILKNQTGKFDIILNDIDKEEYPAVTELAEQKLVKGGILITDNVLWFGRVISDDPSLSTAGVKKFNQDIFSNRKFITSILPVRDGIALSIRI